MPKVTPPLSDMAVRALEPKEKPYGVADGQVPGLYIMVQPTGRKFWRFRYANPIDGKETRLAFGAYPTEMSLKQARERALEVKQGLREGTNPSRRARKAAAGEAFGAVAAEWASQFLVEPRKAASSIKRDKLTLNRHILPALAKTPIGEITPMAMLELLRPFAESGRRETLSRVKIICGQIFKYAVVCGKIPSNPTRELSGALPTGPAGHYPTVTKPDEVGRLMRAIWAYSGSAIVGTALRMLAYVFTRPGELRGAEWAEIDWEDRLWRIPAERMKMRRDHMVPLSDQVLRLLRFLHDYTGKGRYVFTCRINDSEPISNATLNRALRRIGVKPDVITPHGFRSMASTLLNQNGFNADWIEAELAHEDTNKIRAIYNRTSYLEDRRRMMQAWADYLDGLRETAGK